MEGPRNKRGVCEYMLHSLRVRVLLILLLGGLIGLGVPAMLDLFYWDKDSGIRPDCQLPPAFRIDSLPNWDVKDENQEKRCLELGSCWDETVGKEAAPCYHPHPSKYYYEVTSRTECSTEHKRDARLFATAVVPESSPGMERIRRVQLKVEEISDHLVSVRFFDNSHPYGFEPNQFLNYDLRRKDKERCSRSKRLYDVSHLPDIGRHLFVDVKRLNGPSVFNTNFGPLIFESQYIEMTTVLPSANFYGLGQGSHTTFRHNLTNKHSWTLFAGHDDSWGDGVHPFYLCLENDGKAHGVLLEHSNALEITTQDVPAITYRTTGSSLVFHILMGPTPADVIRQLTDLVGRPPMPPYWALGHHVCRSGEVNRSVPLETVNFLNENRIPQESDCWFDSLAMGYDHDWTSVESFARNLHNDSRKLLLVQVPHVLESLFSNGSESLFVRTEDKKKKAEGILNGETVLYPNYFHDEVAKFTKERLEEYMNLSRVTFDGYLLTKNTPVDQRVRSRQCSTNKILNEPQFVPGKGALWDKTMCMDTCFEWFSRESCVRLNAHNHYNVHNLYGHKHMESTAKALNKIEEYRNIRPFLASTSTFSGSGKYGGQFSIGSHSTWVDMKIALVQSLEFNLFGIPLVGSPICGYNFKKEAHIRDLCSRWVQLAAFQPLVLSYHNRKLDPSIIIPAAMDDMVSSVSAASLQLRYSLLPYLYTLFYISSETGAPVMRPLFYEFPQDPVARGIDEQFMWGSGILISPVLKNSTTYFPAYFPKGTWYDFYDGSLDIQSEKGEFKNLTAIEYNINIHLRGGCIVASQKHAILTEQVRNSTFKLRVALDRTKDDKEVSATGQLYIDDGITVNGPALLVNMVAYNHNLTLTAEFLNGADETSFENVNYKLELEDIHIWGLKRTAAYVCKVNNVTVSNGCRGKDEYNTLPILKLKIDLTKNTTVTWDFRD